MKNQNYIYQILMSPSETTLILVDHQSCFASCFAKHDIERAQETVLALANAAQLLNIPTIMSVVETNNIQGNVNPKLEKVVNGTNIFQRTGFNPWDGTRFSGAVRSADRPKLLIAGLSAETSLSFTALCALEEGFDVYVVKDACLAQSPESHSMTFERLTQAGVVPVTWRQVLIEWQHGTVEPGLLKHLKRSAS